MTNMLFNRNKLLMGGPIMSIIGLIVFFIHSTIGLILIIIGLVVLVIGIIWRPKEKPVEELID